MLIAVGTLHQPQKSKTTTLQLESDIVFAAAGCMLWQEITGWLTNCPASLEMPLQIIFAQHNSNWLGLTHTDSPNAVLRVPPSYQNASGWLLAGCPWQTIQPLLSMYPKPFGQVRLATPHASWFEAKADLRQILSRLDILICNTPQLYHMLRNPRLGLWDAAKMLCDLGVNQVGMFSKDLTFYFYNASQQQYWYIPAALPQATATYTLAHCTALGAAGFLSEFCRTFDSISASSAASATATLQTNPATIQQLLLTYPALLPARAAALKDTVIPVNPNGLGLTSSYPNSH
jgi:hypothetical protein